MFYIALPIRTECAPCLGRPFIDPPSASWCRDTQRSKGSQARSCVRPRLGKTSLRRACQTYSQQTRLDQTGYNPPITPNKSPRLIPCKRSVLLRTEACASVCFRFGIVNGHQPARCADHPALSILRTTRQCGSTCTVHMNA